MKVGPDTRINTVEVELKGLLSTSQKGGNNQNQQFLLPTGPLFVSHTILLLVVGKLRVFGGVSGHWTIGEGERSTSDERKEALKNPTHRGSSLGHGSVFFLGVPSVSRRGATSKAPGRKPKATGKPSRGGAKGPHSFHRDEI